MRHAPLIAVVGLLLSWFVLADRAADQLFDRERTRVVGLADEVARDALRRPRPSDFRTGSARFDGEWALGTCLMAVVGLDRALEVAPDRAPAWRPAMRACADQLASPEAQAFGRDPWGDEGPAGRAWEGYLARALASVRRRDPAFDHAELHDATVRRLADRVRAEGLLALETYPGERYPPDQAVVIAALATHPEPDGALVRSALSELDGALDARTGLLGQRVVAGRSVDPRGSGTFFAALWLADVDPGRSTQLYAAGRATLFRRSLGLGAMDERLDGGPGDIDSGPLILGRSVSATGFALAGARTAGDRASFRHLARTSFVFGVPVPTDRGWRYATGGSLGNAILLAALLSPYNAR